MKGILIKIKFLTGYFFIIICLLALTGVKVQGQIITTIAGSGTPGYTGNGGQATLATLDGDSRVSLDDSGNIYISDAGNYVVREVNAKTGIITTVAGNGISGYSGDLGQATDAELGSPQGLCFDDSGNFYIADYGNHVIRKVIKSTGIIITVAGDGTWNYGGDGGQATAAELSLPTGVTLDDSGNIIITDQWNYVIRKVSAKTGIITTIAGNHSQGFSGDGGQATDASLNLPSETVVDDSGNLYILDAQNEVIRKVTETTGIITEYAGTPQVPGYSGDNGPASAAEFNSPSGLCMNDSGNIYVADANNQVIRKITKSTGIITTVGGDNSLGAGFSGDGQPATLAQLNQPDGVTVDLCGNIYIADHNNNRVRKVTVVSTDSLLATASSASICSGVPDTLSVSGGSNFTWSPATGLNSTTGSMVIANPTLTTTYTISGTSACVGAAIPTTVVVTVTSAPPLTVIQYPLQSICSGQSAILHVSDASGLIWTPTTGLIDSTLSNDSVTVSPMVTTTYTVTGISNGCASTGIDTVKVIPAPSFTVLPLDTAFCNGQSGILYVDSGGSNFIWTPINGIIDSTLSGGDSVMVSPTITTTYIVSGMNTLGCATSGTDIVTIIPSPNKPTFTQGGDTLFSSSQYDNQWYRNDTLLVNDTSQYLITHISGEYSVVVTNEANGCSTASDSMQLTGVQQLTTISNQLSIYPNPFNDNINIKINTSIGDIDDWNLQITDVLARTVYSQQSLTYNNKINLSGLSSGVYFVTIINKTGRAVFPVVRTEF